MPNPANKEVMDAKERKNMIYSVIGVAIMLLFRFLPLNLPEVTPVGMQVIGIFLGTLFLWTFVDPLWASLIAIGMIGLSDYAPMPQLLKECFGNATVVQVFFLLIMSGALVYYKVTLYIGRFFLTRKFSIGKPWVLIWVICVGTYFMAGFINAFTAVFLFWAVMYDVFEEVGYKKGDAAPRVILTLIVVSALCGFPMAPYAQNGLALLSNFAKITETLPGGAVHVNNGAYMAVAITTGMLMIACNILIAKFVFRPDMSKLKNLDIDSMNRNPLPPMNQRQKTIVGGFTVLVLCMMLPSLFSKIPGMSFLAQNLNGLPLVAVAILAALRADHEPVLEVPKVIQNNFNWSSYFIIVAAILLGGVLTNESTGVSAFLKVILSPLFTGLSPVAFTVFLLIVAMVLTNMCNSLVIGMILQPVILTYCVQSGANPAPIVTMLIIFVLLSAAVTPAASPFAAVLHSNKEWVPTKYVYTYTIPFVLAELAIIMLVGIPMANLLMAV
ncbi:MAG: SLC13 family permease [Lachnospiraceae bacterium]|nr:SLC13 family permease [Lachnospiraceae bacterium]